MSEYMPKTEDVKHFYQQGADGVIRSELESEFDRWLASVKAEAWEEGAESAYYDPEYRDQVNYPPNPYRKEPK